MPILSILSSGFVRFAVAADLDRLHGDGLRGARLTFLPQGPRIALDGPRTSIKPVLETRVSRKSNAVCSGSQTSGIGKRTGF
jgi:hypothetical protein